MFSYKNNTNFFLVARQYEENLKRPKNSLATSFRTLDATTYNIINTIDLEKYIIDLTSNPNDTYIAVAEVKFLKLLLILLLYL